MMFSRISVLAVLVVSAVASPSVINGENGDIPIDSVAGGNLFKNARKLSNYNSYQGQSQYSGSYQEVNWDDIDTSYLAGYSIKFQGCHHVQQWNDEAEGEDAIKIKTQRLVRFRLCPANACTAGATFGCDSNYGDYVVDMETFVGAYLTQMQETYMNSAAYGGNRELASAQSSNINLADYMECAQMQNANGGRNRDLEGNSYYYSSDGTAYYIGPYCAEQGGEIHLGVFLDDTCTVFADEGADVFKTMHNGVALPYSSQSLVSLQCMSCGGYGQVNELCTDIYKVAGKCETKMSVYYPNESACSYISGIKIIREDGVIRTSATRKSKAASICIGVFLTVAVLLAGYVYYLRTKLGRAKINLAAASQNL
jgi:hypothetical protein